MGYFDFIGDLPRYRAKERAGLRLSQRHKFLIDDFKDEIRGANVLDLASHDGRWCYAFAGAGAASVVGIEARAELVAEFANYPDKALVQKVEFRCGDLFEGIEAAISKGETYDVIGIFGILYHIMDHFRLFQLLRALQPKLLIVDSEFTYRAQPVITLVRERTDSILNATPQISGQEYAVKGVLSFAALEMIAEA